MGAAVVPVLLATTVAAGAISTKAAIDQGKAQSDLAKFRSQVAENNQAIAERAAQEAMDASQVDVAREATGTSQLIGRARASAAARGVVVDEGSSLSIQEDLAAQGASNIFSIRDNAQRRQLAILNQAQEFGQEASLLQTTASNETRAAKIQGGATLLNSGGKVASRWLTFKDTGAGNTRPNTLVR